MNPRNRTETLLTLAVVAMVGLAATSAQADAIASTTFDGLAKLVRRRR